ncbi:hypothetical protein, partial [Enterococcus sp. AZ012]|uniref:hypothetical protein n=1 Tax=Enterococcus sp. AZ012 TaxID=2774682 RepID=UPI003D299251
MNLTIQLFEWLFFTLSGDKLLTQYWCEFVHIQSLAAALSFDATLYGQIQPAVLQLALFKRNTGYARFSPTALRSLGPPVVCNADSPTVYNGLKG